MDGARVQRVCARTPLIRKKPACACSEVFAQARYFQQFFAAVERAVFIAIGNDVLGKGLIQTKSA